MAQHQDQTDIRIRQLTKDNKASANVAGGDPLLAAIDSFLESPGTDTDMQQLHLSVEAVKRRNIEAKIPILNCTMEFECPKTWAELTPTAETNVRHCSTCDKDVTFCTSQVQLDELAVQGACVAFRASEVTQLLGSVKSSGRKVSKDELRSFIDSL